jgi:hypothetical protein
LQLVVQLDIAALRASGGTIQAPQYAEGEHGQPAVNEICSVASHHLRLEQILTAFSGGPGG